MERHYSMFSKIRLKGAPNKGSHYGIGKPLAPHRGIYYIVLHENEITYHSNG
jgi:hypothetical protein